jgi:hypothetical protein
MEQTITPRINYPLYDFPSIFPPKSSSPSTAMPVQPTESSNSPRPRQELLSCCDQSKSSQRWASCSASKHRISMSGSSRRFVGQSQSKQLDVTSESAASPRIELHRFSVTPFLVARESFLYCVMSPGAIGDVMLSAGSVARLHAVEGPWHLEP